LIENICAQFICTQFINLFVHNLLIENICAQFIY